MKRFVMRVFARWVFLFSYFLGLTFLIPSVVSVSVPDSIFFITGSHALLIFLSLIFVFLGIFGMYLLKGDARLTTKALAWATIFPVIIAVLIRIFGDDILLSLIDRFEYLRPVFEYMLKGIPHTTYLIIGYSIIGVGWVYLSRRKTRR